MDNCCIPAAQIQTERERERKRKDKRKSKQNQQTDYIDIKACTNYAILFGRYTHCTEIVCKCYVYSILNAMAMGVSLLLRVHATP